jgi:hypothetical protein
VCWLWFVDGKSRRSVHVHYTAGGRCWQTFSITMGDCSTTPIVGRCSTEHDLLGSNLRPSFPVHESAYDLDVPTFLKAGSAHLDEPWSIHVHPHPRPATLLLDSDVERDGRNAVLRHPIGDARTDVPRLRCDVYSPHCSLRLGFGLGRNRVRVQALHQGVIEVVISQVHPVNLLELVSHPFLRVALE